MPRRSLALPLMLAATVGLFALTSVLTAQPAAKPADAATPDAIKRQQEQNAKLFKDLSQGMLRLAQRLEKSDRVEDQARAKTIRRALELAEKDGVDNLFQKMIANFGKGANPNSSDLTRWIGDDQQLYQSLQDILTVLMTDDDSARLKAEILRLEEFKKEALRIKRAQEIIQARTDAKRGDAAKIAKDQKDLAEQTDQLGKNMAGKKKDDPSKKGDPNANAGEPKEAPAESKPEAKPGEENAENKGDTKEAKSSDKDAQGDGKDPSGKDGPKDGAEAKPAGDPGMKPDDKSGKDGPQAGTGEEKAGDAKGAGEPKEGESKEPKGGDPKAGEPKAGDPKAGEPKPGDPKAGEPKAGDPKPGDPKAGEPKDAQSPSGKPGESKAKSEGKGEGKPSDSQGGEAKPMGGESKSPPSSGKPSGGKPSGSPPPGGQPPSDAKPQDDTPGRKEVQEAYPEQKGAEEDLNKEKRAEASKKEDKAIEKLAKAIAELEKRLKQLREEEMLKLLANLEARCNNMLRMQIEVYENTKSIHAGVVKNNNQKTAAEIQKAQVQSDKEAEIVVEADKAMKMLEGEGSAVAFAGVLAEVRNDMTAVKVRLAAAYVDTDTQQIEKDIIDQLKEMVAALKKAQQEMQQGKPGESGPPGKPGNQPLIDKLAELKLMRALQMQVNSRTTTHAKRYKGEQANDPILQNELRQLSERQAKIQDMLHKLATGANQ